MNDPARRDRADPFAAHVLPEVDVLLRVARTLVSAAEDAEDLVQDTLIRAYRSIGAFDGSHPRAWLLTILRNTHINRSRRNRPGLLDDPDDLGDVAAAAGDGPEAAVVDVVFDAAVETALGNLSSCQRAVIDLVDINGLSYAEAAIVLEVPVGTVMSRLSRARSKIRYQLRSAGVVETRADR